MQHSSECPTTGPTAIEWSPKVEKDIRHIDRAVNNSIVPRNEKIDEWTVNPRTGDCDDFVVSKRHALIEMGYPARALRPKVASRNKPNDHLVLEIVTTRGIYLLDMDRTPAPPMRSKSANDRLRDLLRELAMNAGQ